MNFRLILHMLSVVLLFVGLFMLLPLVVSLFYDRSETTALLASALLTVVTGVIVFFLTKSSKTEEIRHREAFVIVSISWLVVALFGATPYLFTGAITTFTDAYFESMSGFTTTGASVIPDVEILPKGLLFWRSLTQWIGGMGIILFALAILPLIGGGGMQLFKAEVPEISVDKLRPRIIDTSKALWLIYLGLTVTVTLVFLFGGMDLYDAINHAFTTMATGGFSTKNASIAHFKSPFIEYVTSIFMFMAGVNYSLYFQLFRGRPLSLWKNNEFRFYLAVTVLMVLSLMVDLFLKLGTSLEESFRLSLFQVTSIMTTTGFATSDFENWPFFSQAMLLLCMFFGGMIGSTSGGIKQVRVLLMLKQGYRELYQLIHPHAVTTLKLDNKFLTNEVLGSIWGFVFLFMMLCLVSTVAMTLFGVDLITSMTTVLSATSNVGPALGEAGPTENYSKISTGGKWILIFCMLAGRLEVYTILILLVPNFWKK